MVHRHLLHRTSSHQKDWQVYVKDKMDESPDYHGRNLATRSYGSINDWYEHVLTKHEPLGSICQSANPSQSKKRNAPIEDYSEDEDSKKPRSQSPTYSMDSQSRETTLEKLKAAADALNGRYNPRGFAKPSHNPRTSTPEAEITERVAARATAMVIRGQKELWTANHNGLRVFVDSEKGKARQEIKEAGSETRVSIQRSWDLELQRSRAMLHQLLELIEQATQELRDVQEHRESIRRAEQHCYPLYRFTENDLRDFELLRWAQDLGHLEDMDVRIGEEGSRSIKREEQALPYLNASLASD